MELNERIDAVREYNDLIEQIKKLNPKVKLERKTLAEIPTENDFIIARTVLSEIRQSGQVENQTMIMVTAAPIVNLLKMNYVEYMQCAETKNEYIDACLKEFDLKLQIALKELSAQLFIND